MAASLKRAPHLRGGNSRQWLKWSRAPNPKDARLISECLRHEIEFVRQNFEECQRSSSPENRLNTINYPMVRLLFGRRRAVGGQRICRCGVLLAQRFRFDGSFTFTVRPPRHASKDKTTFFDGD